MLVLEVEYLMGRALASRREDRKAVEWPPHPARLFSALVAAYKECDMGEDARFALEWLETLPPPAIYANPPDHEGYVRDVCDVFVPVNDSNDQLKKKKDGKISKFPQISDGIGIRRGRNERWFPAYTPQDRHVWFIWKDATDVSERVRALEKLAANVTYLGHSMSPVRVAAVTRAENISPTLVPHPNGAVMLRTMGPGRLVHLETVFEQRKQNATIQPRLGKVSRYRITGEQRHTTPTSLFRYAFAFRRKSGPRLPLESAIKLTDVVRKAIMRHVPDPIPEILSGHDDKRAPTHLPHLVVAPFADVGHRHADGHVMGFGLWLPGSAREEEVVLLEEAVFKIKELTLGRYGVWQVEQLYADELAHAPFSIRPATYERSHDAWASVTPVVFGKFPKESQVGPGRNGGKVFTELCEMIGLPPPAEVRLGSVSVFRGAPKASEFIRPKQAEGKFMAHVYLRFPERVKGPVLIGAGRFIGLGLCRPYTERSPA